MKNGLVLGLVALASLGAAQAPDPVPEPADIEFQIDHAEYAVAESLAIARWFAQPESTLVEAEACDLFLSAARHSGKAPVDRLLAIAHDNLEFKRRRLGDDDPFLAETFDQIGALHLRADDPEAAAEAYRAAAELRAADAEIDSVEYAGSRTGLAHALLRLRDLEGATRLYVQAEGIVARAEGRESSGLTSSLNGQGLVHQRQDRFDQAENFFRRALKVSRDPEVEEHPRTALVARNLARLLVRQGRLIEAVDPMEEAYRIRKRRLDAQDLLLSNIAFDLGRLNRDLGDLLPALPLLEETLAIRIEKLRPDHRQLEESRWVLAQLYVELGRFADAEALLTQIESAWEEGKGDPDRLLGVRANLRSAMGDFVEARTLYEQLLASREATLGPDHARVAATLHNLAEVLRRLDAAPAALEARRRAVEIQREALDPNDTDLAMGLANLADLELDAKEPALARERLEEANAIFLRSARSDAPLRANVLLLLARCDEQEDRPREALERIDEALALRRSAFGAEHAEVAWTLDRRARALEQSGQSAAAHETALRAAHLVREQLRLSAQTLAERTALRYVQEGRTGLDRAVQLSLQPSLQGQLETTWDAVVRARSLVLDELIERRRLVEDDPSLSEKREALQRARRRLVIASTRPGSTPAQQRELRLAKETAERDLAAASADFRDLQTRSRAGGREVRAALNESEALVSFLRTKQDDGGHRYAAFVVSPKRVAGIDLGDARALETAIDAWRAEVKRPAFEAGSPLAALEADHRAAARALHEMLWKPIEAALGDAQRVYLVPDGRLHLVAFEALVDADDRYLAEHERVMVMLSAERDRLRQNARAGEGVLLVGGPDFGPAGEPESSCPDMASLQFAALPEAAAEAEAVRRHWVEPTLLSGSRATEVAFREQAPGRRWIHVATHGWFLSGSCDGAGEGTRGIGGVSRRSTTPAKPAPSIQSPLLLAGLAFAGANQRAEVGDPASDGLLTAEEIASLDLSGAEGIVLSACDTGLGAIESGEGVLGLQRAFRLAGARGLLLSLWAVQDEATREWMETFYQLLVDEGRSTADAAAGTRRAVLTARRTRGESTHPFFWAAFVASGDTR